MRKPRKDSAHPPTISIAIKQMNALRRREGGICKFIYIPDDFTPILVVFGWTDVRRSGTLSGELYLQHLPFTQWNSQVFQWAMGQTNCQLLKFVSIAIAERANAWLAFLAYLFALSLTNCGSSKKEVRRH